MPNTIDWMNPETFKISDESYERYLNEDRRRDNHIARENTAQSALGAMLEWREKLDAIRIDGKSIDELIRDL